MRVVPAVNEGSLTWIGQQTALITVGVWTEKKPGRGEDAEPLVLYQRPSQRGVLAVCDGVGGAGVQMAGRTVDGTERSGAWVAARAVRLAVEQHFVRKVRADGPSAPPGPAALSAGTERPSGPTRPAAPSLHQSVDSVLGDLRNPSRSRIGGTMQRTLPSTLAAIFYRQRHGAIQGHIRWAGDSRCYLLTADTGLQQLSEDDTDTPNALSSLEQDPPMNNQISADGRYHIHDQRDQMALPCVLLCATDGFFNYVQTPAHFEYLLLSTLSESADAASWASALGAKVQTYTQDDASLALAAIGYPDFTQLRMAFERRLSILSAEHWQPFQKLNVSDGDAFRKARLESWQKYRDDYERRILRPAGGLA